VRGKGKGREGGETKGGRGEKGREERERDGGEGKGGRGLEEGKGRRERSPPPPFQIPASAPDMSSALCYS